MSPLKTSLITALVAAALTAGSIYLVQHHRAQEVSSLRSKNNKMRYQANQRRLVQSAAPAVSAVQNMAAAVVSSVPVRAPGPPENYRNEGQATPRATLQTFAWACDRGDTETIAKLLFFDGEARKKFAAHMAALPATEQMQWKTAEEMAAMMLTISIMARPFPNADVLEAVTIEQVGEDRAMLRLRGTSKDRTQFQKTAGGWNYVITEAMADALITLTKNIPMPPR